MKKGIFLVCFILITLSAVTAFADTDINILSDSAVPGQVLKAEVISDLPEGEYVYKWVINSEVVSESDTYTPTDADLGNFITASVYNADGLRLASDKMYCSKLPVIYINTTGGKEVISKDEYITARMSMQGNGTYNSKNSDLYEGSLEIRGRGNSSWFEFTKKPYKIKLGKKADLFGMGKSKHWVLIANEMDESLMRSRLAYDVADKMGLVVMDTEWVDLIMNGSYAGNYLLSEHVRIDDDRVDIYNWEELAEDLADAIYLAHPDTVDEVTYEDMTDYLTEDLSWITEDIFEFNGQRYVIDNYIKRPEKTNGGVLMEYNRLMDEVSQFQTDMGSKITVSYPEYIATNNQMFNSLKGYVNKVENFLSSENSWYGNFYTTYNNKEVGYVDLIDFDSYVGTWVLQQFFCNGDLGSKSTYMYWDVDGKLVMGPIWDWDWASGVISPWSEIRTEGMQFINRQFIGLCRDPHFIAKAYELYHKIRNEVIIDMLMEGGTIDTYHDYLQESALKNEELWKYNLGFEGNVTGLKEWFMARLSYLDGVFASEEALFKALGGDRGWFKAPLNGFSVKITHNTQEIPKNALCPADYYLKHGEDVTIMIASTDTNITDVQVSVNNNKAETVKLSSGTATVTLDKALFDEEIGTFNTITIRGTKGTEFIGYNFATVIFNDNSTLKGEGTFENPYEISSNEDLQTMARKVNNNLDDYDKACYVVTSDIEVTDFTPIGNDANSFKGYFNGNGHTIKGVTINTTEQYAGLFGVIGNNGVVRNVILTDVNINATGVRGKNIGGIAGHNKGIVANCSVSGVVNAFDDGGAIAGKNSGCVENCINNATVTLYMKGVGSAVGNNTKSAVVSNCGETPENNIIWDTSSSVPVLTGTDAAAYKGTVKVTDGLSPIYITYENGVMTGVSTAIPVTEGLIKAFVTSGDNYGFISIQR